MSRIAVRFFHGLGDRVHFAHLLQLYRRRGYSCAVHSGNDRTAWLWPACGVEFHAKASFPEVPFEYPQVWYDHVRSLAPALDEMPEHEAHKIPACVGVPPMPSLGLTPWQTWRELCGVRLDLREKISQQAQQEADRFLDGLRRPIVALHTIGNCMTDRKSVPSLTTLETIRALVDAACSVVLIDWTGREPLIGSKHCRGILPGWGPIDLERQLALYSRVDLMAGIDSGPFHAAALVGCRRLGLFPSNHLLLPWRCCLPAPGDMYLVERSCERAAGQRTETYPCHFYDHEIKAPDIMGAVSKSLEAAPWKE